MGEPTRKDKILYVLLSPLALGWSGLNFWWLATEGRIPVRGDVGMEWVDSGVMFWSSLLLYVVLFVGGLVTQAFFLRWLWRKVLRTPDT